MLDKIERLSAADDFVVYRWITYGKRIENTYNRLADVRLQGIRYGNGQVWLFEAAPILTYSRGTCCLIMRTDGIYSILSGESAGLLVSSIPEEGSVPYTPAVHMTSEQITDSSPKHKLELVRTLATSPYIPVSNVVVPNLCRLTRNLDRIRVRMTAELATLLGVSAAASQDEITEALRSKIDTIAARTNSGYVIPADIIYAGGTVVCDSSMVSRKAVSSIFGMPGCLFDRACMVRSWNIKTNNRNEEQQC